MPAVTLLYVQASLLTLSLQQQQHPNTFTLEVAVSVTAHMHIIAKLDTAQQQAREKLSARAGA
jgi:hypothetical protein